MPGDHENVVKLNADHRGVCKFGAALEDQDNFELVRSNIKDLHENALKIGESSIINPVSVREPRIEGISCLRMNIGISSLYRTWISLIPFLSYQYLFK
jgi:hypothetical protein